MRRLPPVAYTDEQWRRLESLGQVLRLAVAQLQLVFAERGEIDFTEVMLRAQQALGDEEAPTDLALLLDHRISHLLVDEAAPEPTAALEALLPLPPHLVEVGLEEPVEGRRTGIPGPVAGRAALSHSDARRLLQRGRAASA